MGAPVRLPARPAGNTRLPRLASSWWPALAGGGRPCLAGRRRSRLTGGRWPALAGGRWPALAGRRLSAGGRVGRTGPWHRRRTGTGHWCGTGPGYRRRLPSWYRSGTRTGHGRLLCAGYRRLGDARWRALPGPGRRASRRLRSTGHSSGNGASRSPGDPGATVDRLPTAIGGRRARHFRHRHHWLRRRAGGRRRWCSSAGGHCAIGLRMTNGVLG